MKKKFRTVLLAALLCFGVLSTGVLATGGDPVSCGDLNELTTGLTTDYKPNGGDVIAKAFYLTQDISADENSKISIQEYRSIDLKEYSLTGNATITVPNGSSFHIQGSGMVEWTIVVESGGTLYLTGGTFNTITVEDGGKLDWTSSYENGEYICYVFRTGTSEEAYDYSRTFSTGATVVPCPHKSYTDGKCKVCEAKCTHKTVDNNGKCTTCGYQYAVCGLKYNGPDPDTMYYTSATAAMKSSCNTVKLLADCDETVRCSSSGTTVDLNGHRLKELHVEMQGSTEFSFTIEDSSATKTGTITTLTVNSYTTLKGGRFGTITTEKNGGNIPLPVGYAFQHTGENGSGTDFVKRSEIGSSLSDVMVVEVGACTTHEYAASGMCEICGEECQHGTVSDEGVCSTCKQQFAGKVINNGTTKWFATFSKAWEEIMTQKNSPVPVQFELYQDIEADGQLDVTGLDLILCLNGHTLKRENFDATNGKLSLTSGDGKSGTLAGPVASGTGGQFSTSGDVTINGDVTLGSSSDSLGLGTTISGKVTSNSSKTIQAHLSGTHPVLFTKGEDGNYTQFVNGDVTQITGPVKIVECTSHSYIDGKCEYCGAECTHENINSSGSCPDCHEQFKVKRVMKQVTTWWNTVSNAMRDVGDTSIDVTLYQNLTEAVTISSGTMDLYLNGKTLNGTLTVSGGDVSVRDGNDDGSSGDVTVSGGTITGNVTISGGKVWFNRGTFGNVTVRAGNVSIWDGTFTKLEVTESGTCKVTHGTFGTITNSKTGGKAIDLLTSDYAFAKANASSDTAVENVTTASTLVNVKVIAHSDGDHADPNKDGVCDFCGQTIVAKVTGGETEKYYADFRIAAGNAGSEQTVVLLSDVELSDKMTFGSKNTANLDLNGKTIRGGSISITSGATVTLTDSSDETSGKITSPITVSGSRQSGNLIVNNAVTLDSVTVTAGTLTVNDNAQFTSLSVSGGTATLNGGTFSTLTTGGSVKIGGLLKTGYGFKSSSAWYDGSSIETSVSNVSVKKLPIQSVSISTNGNKTSFAYGEGIWLVATPMLTETSTPTYEWMNMDGSEQTFGDKQGFWLNYLAPNEYTIQCTVTVDGYSISEHIEFTVTKATLTDKYTAPTAETGLTYMKGTDQVLIKTGSFGSNVTITDSGFPKFWYGTKNADNSISWTMSGVTGRNAGEYMVYWYIAGGDNYNDVGSAEQPYELPVTIDPQSVEPTVTVAGGSTYDGAEKKPSVTVKLDGATLTENTDYTVSYEDNVNAGENTAKAIVSAASGGNYKFDPVTKTFTIDKAAAVTLDNITVNRKYTTTGEQSTQIGSIMPADAGTLSYSVGSSSVSGTATVSSFTVSDSGLVKYTITGGTVGTVITLPVKINSANYAESTVNVVVTLTEKDNPTVTADDITTAYTGSEIPASAITGTATFGEQSVAGSWSFTNAAPKSVSDSNDRVSVTFTPVDTANFNAATTTIKVTITKATPTGAPKYTAISTSSKTLADANLTTKDGTFSVPGTVKWIDADGNDLAETTEVAANTTYKWLFTPTDTTNYNTLTGSITLWHRSGGGSSSNSTSTTVKNPDGSTTTTTTDKKTGEVTETTKAPNGVTGTTVTDKDGNVTDISANIPASAAKNGETVTLPIDEVKPENGTTIDVDVPAGGATVEIPVTNPTPGTVIVIVDKDGNETVVSATKQTENGVSVTLTEDATIKVIDNSKDFSDVKDSDYFGNAVQWASARNITGGTSATTFGPHDSCTRAQLVTFLYRYAQSQGGGFTGAWMFQLPFSDVPEWCYEAVAWCYMNNIVGGYGNGLFGSNDTITREQMAVILYRFAQKTGLDTTQGGMAVREYSDYENISDYAVTAMQWAVNAGVMAGYQNNLMPGQPCTRAQIVTMLYRLLSGV